MKYVKVSDSPARYVDFSGIRTLTVDSITHEVDAGEPITIYGVTDNYNYIKIGEYKTVGDAEKVLAALIEKLNGGKA